MSQIKTAGDGAKKPKNLLKTQKIIAIVLVFAVVLLAVALFAVKKIIEGIPIEIVDPNDNAIYYIKKVNGEYALYYEDGSMCPTSEDGYYITLYGTRIKVDRDSGEYVVDSSRKPIFNQLFYDAYNSDGSAKYDKSRIVDRIDVSNMNGSYSFVRGEINSFILENHPNVPYSQETFAYLAVACTYPLTLMTLENPKSLPNGEIDWAEYGLAYEKRVTDGTDDSGNKTEVSYDYSPACVKLTAADGKEYVLYYGDATITGSSFYVRYLPDNAVYVLNGEGIEKYLLKGVESVISPTIVYPMRANDYFDVEDFIIYSQIDHEKISLLMKEKFGDFDRDSADSETIEEYDRYYSSVLEEHSKKLCHFSSEDVDKRSESMYATLPYISHLEYSAGYYINSNNISNMLQKLYQTTFTGTQKLSPSEEDLRKYGLENPAYVITFKYPYTNEDKKEEIAYNKVYISKQNSDGSYYAYSDMYDMIVGVDESSFSFLNWSELDWYDTSYMQFPIGYVSDLIVEAPGTNIHFTLDSSMTSNGLFYPITDTTFTDGDGNSYKIKREGDKYAFFGGDKALKPLYNQDYLITGIPLSAGVAEAENYLFAEVQTTDTDGDGNDDAYVYYYYNITYNEGKYTLYASMAVVDANGQPASDGRSILIDPVYSTECFVTSGFSQYAFLVPQSSEIGKQLSEIYLSVGKGQWMDCQIFVTAKNKYIVVNPETGAWATISSLSNTVYIADRDHGKLQASGVVIDAYGVRETVYTNTGKVLSYDDEARIFQLYDKATQTRKNAAKAEVAPGIWSNGDFYVSLTGDLLVIDPDTGDAGLADLKASDFYASVYADGAELNYSYSLTDTLGNSSMHSAIYNFQQFYTALLYGSFEGICDMSEDELENLRSLDNFSDTDASNPCMLKITIYAKDLKGNERNIVYRFYRISERRAYMTIEALDSPNSPSSSENAYGKFYTLASYADKLCSDANKVINGIAVDANSKY